MRLKRKISRDQGMAKAGGFTLIECLVYIAVLLTVSGMAYLTFYRTRDNARDLSRSADDIARVMTAGERWREDVRSATGRMEVSVGETGQTLRIPQAQGEVNYLFRTNEISRQARSESSPVFLLGRVKTSTMQADARERVMAWRWEVELEGRPGHGRLRPLFSFEAVPGKGAAR